MNQKEKISGTLMQILPLVIMMPGKSGRQVGVCG